MVVVERQEAVYSEPVRISEAGQMVHNIIEEHLVPMVVEPTPEVPYASLEEPVDLTGVQVEGAGHLNDKVTGSLQEQQGLGHG